MSPETLAQLIYNAANDIAQSGQAGNLTVELIPAVDSIAVMRPKDRSHGDWATNIAMRLAKQAGMAPRDLAQLFADRLQQNDGIKSVEVAGPGFINVTLDSASAAAVIDTVLSEGTKFGTNDHLGGTRFNLEYVSANPTGPIHIGGARWAAVGEALTRVMHANGADVVREYYFNDHGVQIDRFARTLVAAAHHEPTPEDGYKGAYVDEIAERTVAQAKADGVDILNLPRVTDPDGSEGDSEQRREFRKRAVPMMFDEIKKSLHEFRSDFEVWTSEQSLYDRGLVDRAINYLRSQGKLYEKDGATWFKSSDFGDDKDRVIIKSDGTSAYFCADIGYYYDKRHREVNPCDVAIIMVGADHSGWVGRMEAMCAAYGDTPYVNLQILLGQLVNIYKDGKPVRMSKRAGNVVTLDDLVDAIGVDAGRYSLIRTGYNQMLDIDLNLLNSHSNENPVYYVQYAHARSKNVVRNAAAAGISTDNADLSLLDTQADSNLIAQLALYPSVVTTAGDLREPARIAHYLEDLAGAYHTWYSAERVVPMDLTDHEKKSDDSEAIRINKCPEPARAAARLKLNNAASQVLENALDLLGVSAPEKM